MNERSSPHPDSTVLPPVRRDLVHDMGGLSSGHNYLSPGGDSAGFRHTFGLTEHEIREVFLRLLAVQPQLL